MRIKNDNYDVLYVVEKGGKPIKVGLRGQNAYARKKDAEAIITRLVAGRWPYGIKDGSREEFQIRKYVPVGGEPQYKKVKIASNGPTAHDAYIEIDGHLVSKLKEANLEIAVDSINTLKLTKYVVEDLDIDVEADVKYEFILPENVEEVRALYHQILSEFGEELANA